MLEVLSFCNLHCSGCNLTSINKSNYFHLSVEGNEALQSVCFFLRICEKKVKSNLILRVVLVLESNGF